MSHEFEMIAKTFKGLEEVLAGELVALGANNVEIGRRAVNFTGDNALLYKANLHLRTASRILKPLHTFRAKDADEVYEAVKRMDWSKYMHADQSFAIDSTVFSDTFRHSRYVTYRVKDAIVDYFREKENRRPNVKVTSPDLYINVHIANETVTISLDSSGESLHKRGWRDMQTTAPINEALAAGLLLIAGWDGSRDLVDPMCGSGTFLIEAAMIALNIPPGIYRQGFAFEHWLDFDRELFEDLYNDDSAEREFAHHIYGSDSSFYAIKAAEKNIKSAGLQKYISVRQAPLQTLQAPSQDCLVLSNPPYGERIEPADIFKLYSEIGTLLKHQFAGNTAWLISSNEDALKHIGLKPSKKIKMLNGDLDCLFVKYDLFKGEHKEYKKAKIQEPRAVRREDKPAFKDSRKPKKEYKKAADREGRAVRNENKKKY